MTAATTVVEPTEAEMTSTVMEAAHVLGWRVAHFRPANTKRGWRTAVQGDGAGFPDLVCVHPTGGRVLFVELKSAKGRLKPEQEKWGIALIQAGAVWHVVRGKAGLDQFVDMLTQVPTGRPVPSHEMVADLLSRALT